jgi:hypothetical protein
VADGNVAIHRGQCLFVKHLANEAEILEHKDL